MVGTHAGDMIGEIALAIEMGADAVDIGKTIHPHRYKFSGLPRISRKGCAVFLCRNNACERLDRIDVNSCGCGMGRAKDGGGRNFWEGHF